MTTSHLGTVILALHEDEADRADGGDHVDDEQDQRADRAGPRERGSEDLPVPTDAHDDVRDDHEDHDRERGHGRRALPRHLRQPALGADDVPVDREQQPRRTDHACEAAPEGADGGAERDDVADPCADVGRAEIAHQRAGPDERRHPGRIRPETHHLDRGHHDEEDAAEDRSTEDGARDVAARVRGFLAEGGRRFEAGEGEEAEHDAEEHVAGRRARRDGEHVQRELLVAAVRDVARDEADEHNDRDDHDDRDGRRPRWSAASTCRVARG